jgi:hypothetical protein
VPCEFEMQRGASLMSLEMLVSKNSEMSRVSV